MANNNSLIKKHGFDNPFYYQSLENQLQQRRSLSSSTSSFSSTSSVDTSPLSDQPPGSPLTVSSSEGEDDDTKRIVTAMECQQCVRKGAPLFCFSCGFWMPNGRVAQTCSQHPKVIFYTDFKVCPKCKKAGCLRELD